MDHLRNVSAGWLSPDSWVGAALLAVLFFVLASVVVLLIRGGTRRVERHLSDVTALQFVSALAQLLTYLVGFVLYAHLVPPLRALGTALLAGVSVVSVVVGLAAQSTLGNLIAGFSLVLYRQIRVGDSICLNAPKGVVTARVEAISLGFTVLRDELQHEVIVPNSVMMNSTVIRVGRAAG
ncbi:mechanosensitive ion channel family protein [Paenacidovorax monticola]|uniref:Small-conductance mechanosensitive channel n=1 Tax=Paenacidovorax monticola TaxID=1926868 RepID=A0A7H0HE04_9BURK|nr:mechanosensitive ion channel family protein [Paenacidovorax monticola]QNP58770.1 mechanosensitive ion channel family protein [Paenacidovorax monticola]